MSQERTRAAAVVTVSDGVAQGTRDDASGRAVATLLEANGFAVIRREVVPDEQHMIAALLREMCDEGTPLVATTGGTGFGPRDVTPETTRAVIDREAPGLAEEMRAAGRAETPMASLSRAVAGSIGGAGVATLPGGPQGGRRARPAALAGLPPPGR